MIFFVFKNHSLSGFFVNNLVFTIIYVIANIINIPTDVLATSHSFKRDIANITNISDINKQYMIVNIFIIVFYLVELIGL